jgi:hypothetical protein
MNSQAGRLRTRGTRPGIPRRQHETSFIRTILKSLIVRRSLGHVLRRHAWSRYRREHDRVGVRNRRTASADQDDERDAKARRTREHEPRWHAHAPGPERLNRTRDGIGPMSQAAVHRDHIGKRAERLARTPVPRGRPGRADSLRSGLRRGLRSRK